MVTRSGSQLDAPCWGLVLWGRWGLVKLTQMCPLYHGTALCSPTLTAVHSVCILCLKHVWIFSRLYLIILYYIIFVKVSLWQVMMVDMIVVFLCCDDRYKVFKHTLFVAFCYCFIITNIVVIIGTFFILIGFLSCYLFVRPCIIS